MVSVHGISLNSTVDSTVSFNGTQCVRLHEGALQPKSNQRRPMVKTSPRTQHTLPLSMCLYVCMKGFTSEFRAHARMRTQLLQHCNSHSPCECTTIALEIATGWQSIVVSRMQWKLSAQAAIMGGNIRVGLEDNFYLPNGEMARSNGALVDQASQLARMIGREPASI